jgi:hypothetical protein
MTVKALVQQGWIHRREKDGCQQKQSDEWSRRFLTIMNGIAVNIQKLCQDRRASVVCSERRHQGHGGPLSNHRHQIADTNQYTNETAHILPLCSLMATTSIVSRVCLVAFGALFCFLCSGVVFGYARKFSLRGCLWCWQQASGEQ